MSEPIKINQPFTATLTIVSDIDRERVVVSLGTTGRSYAEPREDVISTISLKANEPVVVTATFTFLHEGWFDVYGWANPTDFVPTGDSIVIHLTPDGGTLNPPPGDAATPGELLTEPLGTETPEPATPAP